VKVLVALASLTLAACAGPGDRREYDYLVMHYEADPDNEKDPEHIFKAFNQCLSSNPVRQQWKAGEAKLGPETDTAAKASSSGTNERESIATEAMKRGSKLQALVDQCMARKGYRALTP
jgi:hypothetical protein